MSPRKPDRGREQRTLLWRRYSPWCPRPGYEFDDYHRQTSNSEAGGTRGIGLLRYTWIRRQEKPTG